MATQKVDRFCCWYGELYDENDRFCVKCDDNRKSTRDSEGDKGLQGRIQRFWKGGTLCWPPWLAEEGNFRFQMV